MRYNNPRFTDDIDMNSEDDKLPQRYEIQINEETIMM